MEDLGVCVSNEEEVSYVVQVSDVFRVDGSPEPPHVPNGSIGKFLILRCCLFLVFSISIAVL